MVAPMERAARVLGTAVAASVERVQRAQGVMDWVLQVARGRRGGKGWGGIQDYHAKRMCALGSQH